MLSRAISSLFIFASVFQLSWFERIIFKRIIFCRKSCIFHCRCYLEYPGCGRFGRPSAKERRRLGGSGGGGGGGGGGSVDTEDRIINGVEVTEQRPWMARIIYITDSN